MADGLAEAGAVAMAHGQQRDLVVEIDKTLDDDLATAGAPAFLGVVPGGIHLVFCGDRALALA